MQQPISMIRGTTDTITIAVYDAGGNSYALTDTDVLRFGLKRSPDDKECLLTKELTSANADENGEYVLVLNPEDTADLELGSHYYDVGLQSGTAYHNVIECSEFYLAANITEASNA